MRTIFEPKYLLSTVPTRSMTLRILKSVTALRCSTITELVWAGGAPSRRSRLFGSGSSMQRMSVRLLLVSEHGGAIRDETCCASPPD